MKLKSSVSKLDTTTRFTCPFATRLTLLKHQTLHFDHLHSSLCDCSWKERECPVTVFATNSEGKPHWEINKTLQIVWFPLFSHNCPMVPSALLAEQNQAVGGPKDPQAAAFHSWVGEKTRSLQQSQKCHYSGGSKVFYHFSRLVEKWKWMGKRGLGRSKKISPKILFHISKGNDFFGHRLHFGKVATSK